VEVHDNNTLFDKLYFTETGREEYSEPSEDEINRIKALHKLTGFILLTSQGVPILHLGQDFMRTKQGVENSYNSGDVINKIDWTRKARFFDVFTYYQALIDIRNKHPLFRLVSDEDVRKNLVFSNDFPTDFMHCIKYTLINGSEFGDTAAKILVAINPYPKEYVLHLGECYSPLLIGSQYYKDESQQGIYDITLPPLSGNILFQK
jgi:pullulanase